MNVYRLNHLITAILIVFILSSCGSEPIERQSIVTTDTVVQSEETHDFYVPDDPIDSAFLLSEMPAKWWLLTNEANGFVRYDHWDAQDEYIEFSSTKNGEWWLEILYAQDTDAGPVTDFNATIIEGDGLSTIKGSFTFSGSFDDTPRQISFIWNQLRYHAKFENLKSETTYYVADVSKDFFPFEKTFREAD